MLTLKKEAFVSEFSTKIIRVVVFSTILVAYSVAVIGSPLKQPTGPSNRRQQIEGLADYATQLYLRFRRNDDTTDREFKCSSALTN